MKTKILLIGGPTAVGKTDFSIKCAKLFGGEIISADSIQIYKNLNIGSAKATEEEQKQAKHHLLDIVDTTANFSVSEFKDRVEKLIESLSKNNKLPIIVGGTGLFMKGLLFPYTFGESEKNTEIRNKYNKLREEFGNEYIHNLLKEVDLESANKIPVNDYRRVIRALEIYESTGKKKSDQKLELESKYDYKMIFLDDDRDLLYKRINTRVDKMFNEGLVEEVTNLVKQFNLTRDHQSMQGIGYREFFDYFEGKISLDEVKENIKKDTRHYAKRQITWFKAMPNVVRCNCRKTDEILSEIESWLTSKKV